MLNQFINNSSNNVSSNFAKVSNFKGFQSNNKLSLNYNNSNESYILDNSMNNGIKNFQINKIKKVLVNEKLFPYRYYFFQYLLKI